MASIEDSNCIDSAQKVAVLWIAGYDLSNSNIRANGRDCVTSGRLFGGRTITRIGYLGLDFGGAERRSVPRGNLAAVSGCGRLVAAGVQHHLPVAVRLLAQ